MREGANSRQPMAKAPAVGRARRPRVWDALTGREGFRGGGPWALPTPTMAQAFGLKGELPFSVQNRALHEQPSIEKIGILTLLLWLRPSALMLTVAVA